MERGRKREAETREPYASVIIIIVVAITSIIHEGTALWQGEKNSNNGLCRTRHLLTSNNIHVCPCVETHQQDHECGDDESLDGLHHQHRRVDVRHKSPQSPFVGLVGILKTRGCAEPDDTTLTATYINVNKQSPQT